MLSEINQMKTVKTILYTHIKFQKIQTNLYWQKVDLQWHVNGEKVRNKQNRGFTKFYHEFFGMTDTFIMMIVVMGVCMSKLTKLNIVIYCMSFTPQ